MLHPLWLALRAHVLELPLDHYVLPAPAEAPPIAALASCYCGRIGCDSDDAVAEGADAFDGAFEELAGLEEAHGGAGYAYAGRGAGEDDVAGE